jgi:hypothetical protein
VARALDDRGPFARRSAGIDARLLLLGNRLLPARLLGSIIERALGLPAPGTRRGDGPRLNDRTPDTKERKSLG